MPSSSQFRDKIMVVPYAFLPSVAANHDEETTGGDDDRNDDSSSCPYILMFKDARHDEWGPVSGGRKRGESAIVAAARELEEESNGVLRLSQLHSRDSCSRMVFHTTYRPTELRTVDTIRNGGKPISVRSRYTLLLFRLAGIRSRAGVARLRDAYFLPPGSSTKAKNNETCDIGAFRITPHGLETSSHDQKIWDFVRDECVPRLVAFFFFRAAPRPGPS